MTFTMSLWDPHRNATANELLRAIRQTVIDLASLYLNLSCTR